MYRGRGYHRSLPGVIREGAWRSPNAVVVKKSDDLFVLIGEGVRLESEMQEGSEPLPSLATKPQVHHELPLFDRWDTHKGRHWADLEVRSTKPCEQWLW